MKKYILLILVFSFIGFTDVFAEEDKPLVFLTVTSKQCETCKKLEPVIEELEYEYSGKVKFVTLQVGSKQDLEESKQIAEGENLTSLLEKYKTRIPQIGILCPNAHATKKNFVGETRKEIYEEVLDSIISNKKEICNL